MKVDLTVYVDEFGSDILAPFPSEPFGVGFFACRDEDINALNEKLAREIPQKIHLQECGKEELRDMVEKVSCFLVDCGKDIYGGSVMFSKPELFKIAEDYSASDEKVENWGLRQIVGESSKIISTGLALAYGHCSEIQASFVFEETGNHQDYQKRMGAVGKDIGEGWKEYIRKLYNLPEMANNIDNISISFDSCESKNNIKLAQLADVFAFISRKVCCTNDSFSRELHGTMENHFNFFDSFKGKEIIQIKGVFDVHKTMTKERVIKEVSGLKR